MTDQKIIQLAKHLEIDADEISTTDHCDSTFEVYPHSYLVLDDAEADEACAEYCRQSAWAFKPEFLVDYVPDAITAEHIETMRSESCEDFNEPILALIKAGRGFDEFVSGAIGADGRGHFLSTYDGEESETEDFFIYEV